MTSRTVIRPINNRKNVNFQTILATIIVTILLVVILIISHLLQPKETAGITGIAKIDGYNFGVFKTENEAIEHTIEIQPGTKKIEIVNNKGKNVDVSTGIFFSLVTKTSANEFLLDLNEITEEPIIVAIWIGSDGSLVSKYLSEEVQRYYFSVSVKNPIEILETNNATASTKSSKIIKNLTPLRTLKSTGNFIFYKKN